MSQQTPWDATQEELERLRSSNETLRASNEAMLGALLQVRDLIKGYMDVSDGDYGKQEANNAVKAATIIDEVLP